MLFRSKLERREFINMLGVGLALGTASCRRPEKNFASEVFPDENNIPGNFNYYNTIFNLKNIQYGITVKTFDARPIKIDGNLNHPANLGAASAIMQATIYDLYNPERFRKPTINGKEVYLRESINQVKQKINSTLAENKKVAFIIDEHNSPSLSKLINLVENDNSLVEFICIPSLLSNSARANELLFGVNCELIPDLSIPNLIITFGDDFLGASKLSLYNHIKLRERNESFSEVKILSVNSFDNTTNSISHQKVKISPEEYENILLGLLFLISQSNYNSISIIIYKKLKELNLNIDRKSVV